MAGFEVSTYGRFWVSTEAVSEGGTAPRMRFVQTLDELDKVVRGWQHSYLFCNSPQTMADLDAKIDDEIVSLVNAYQRLARGADAAAGRRLLGVQLLTDQQSLTKGGTARYAPAGATSRRLPASSVV